MTVRGAFRLIVVRATVSVMTGNPPPLLTSEKAPTGSALTAVGDTTTKPASTPQIAVLARRCRRSEMAGSVEFIDNIIRTSLSYSRLAVSWMRIRSVGLRPPARVASIGCA